MGAEPYAIRRATPEDTSAICACARAAYRRYVAAIGREPAPMVADFDAAIAAGQAYVAEQSRGTMLGFAVFFPRQGDMFLENVAVFPEAAGQGVGRALIGFCEAEARRLGLGAVTLYTNARMTENLAIYPHLGYAETARRREDGFDRVYFEKSVRES